jgi:hypothetical protein
MKAGAMVLVGMKAIASFLGCERDRVRALKRAGAPIRVIGKKDGKRYFAESESLLRWIRNEPAPSRT